MEHNSRSNLNFEYVILYNSESDLEELKQIIKKYHPQIITFNLESHNILLENHISHKLSEDYLNENDLDIIQDHAYRFSQWYSAPTVSKLIEYDGINIGELFYTEFSYFLTPFLKKMYEIMKIFKVHNTALFFSSKSLVKFIKFYSSNVKILEDNLEYRSSNNKNSIKKLNKNSLINNHQKFLISNIIKISYKFFNVIFQSKKIDSTKKTIFLINHTTKNFQKFFEQLPNYPINLIKYDNIVPAFWDLKSFLTIKNSNCYIEHSANIPDYVSFQRNPLLIDQLNTILKNEEFFNKFFTLNGFIFWNIIKNDFIKIYKKSFLNLNQNINRVKFLIKKYNPHYIIINSEDDPLDLITIKIAQKFDIKIGLLQHALYNDDLKNLSYYAFKSDQFYRSHSVYSDNLLVWDKLTQNTALKHNVDPKKIIPLGCPFFDMFFHSGDKNADGSKNKYILLAITPSTDQNNTKELSTKIQIEYQNVIKQICQIITKMNKKLTIKVHHGSTFDEKIVRKINPKIIIKNTGSFYQQAKNCELLICIDNSTAILEAMLLHKPVITILVKDKDSDSEIFKNNHTVKTEISHLEEILIKLFQDSKFKQSCIDQGKKFVNDHLINPGYSTESLLDFLSNMPKKEN